MVLDLKLHCPASNVKIYTPTKLDSFHPLTQKNPDYFPVVDIAWYYLQVKSDSHVNENADGKTETDLETKTLDEVTDAETRTDSDVKDAEKKPTITTELKRLQFYGAGPKTALPSISNSGKMMMMTMMMIWLLP